jgi:hypothetical protein
LCSFEIGIPSRPAKTPNDQCPYKKRCSLQTQYIQRLKDYSKLTHNQLERWLTWRDEFTNHTCMQKIILWSLSGLVSALLLVNLLLGLSTRGAISKIQAVQAQVANGPQMETVLRNLSIRIAMAGEKDAAFRDILKKHELNVKLEDKQNP